MKVTFKFLGLLESEAIYVAADNESVKIGWVGVERTGEFCGRDSELQHDVPRPVSDGLLSGPCMLRCVVGMLVGFQDGTVRERKGHHRRAPQGKAFDTAFAQMMLYAKVFFAKVCIVDEGEEPVDALSFVRVQGKEGRDVFVRSRLSERGKLLEAEGA